MRQILLLAVALAMSGCTDAPSNQSANASAPAACADSAARLPGTGLCPADASAMLPAATGFQATAPDGCTWSVGEAALPDAQWLLYRAARCGTKTTQLAYASAKPLAQLSYATSAYYGDDAKGQTIVQVAPVSNGDANATIVALARGAAEDPAKAVGCAVRPAGIEGWAQGALVVDIPAAEAAKLPQDEIRSACGPLGLDQGSQRFWRAFQGHVWLFDLGQEAPDVDPGSLTLVRKDGDGGWARLP